MRVAVYPVECYDGNKQLHWMIRSGSWTMISLCGKTALRYISRKDRPNFGICTVCQQKREAA